MNKDTKTPKKDQHYLAEKDTENEVFMDAVLKGLRLAVADKRAAEAKQKA